jgi:hypothetical protein
MKKISLILILILLCAVAIRIFPHAKDTKSKIAPKSMSKSEVKLRSEMRVLWESRATLLRNYIVSATNDSKDADEARDKLLKNAGDLGASIRPYYGYFAGGILAGLLKKDVALTAKVIKAVKVGNKKDLDWDRNAWYANAFTVAGFFAIPHNQTMKDLTNMFYKHLDLTLGEIEAILKKEKAKDLEYYEKDKAHMLMVSDVLVDGLVRQMPKKFKE